MAKKTLVKQIEEYVELHVCPRTGVAWVENGNTGCGHSAHSNIDATGSIRGMKNLGHWKQDARTRKTHGFIYNIDSYVVTDMYDEVAAKACRCAACNERRVAEDG